MFDEADPAAARPAERAEAMIYRFHDMADADGKDVEGAITTTNYAGEIAAACDRAVPRDDELCAIHVSAIGAAMDVLREARELRLIIWETSMISSARFADIFLSRRAHWDDFVARHRAYLNLDAESLRKEIDDEKKRLRDDDKFAREDAGNATWAPDAPCAAEPLVVHVGLAHDPSRNVEIRMRALRDIGRELQRVCNYGSLGDADCGRLIDYQKMRFRLLRPGGVCDERSPPAPAGLLPSPKLDREFRCPLDGLLPPVPAPLVGDWAPRVRRWRPPPGGVPALLAAEVTAYWRRRRVSAAATRRAADLGADCVLIQVLNRTVYVETPPEKLAAWDAILDGTKAPGDFRPWREQRRVETIGLIMQVADELDDVEVAFCPSDCVMDSEDAGHNRSFYEHHGARVGESPALGLVGCRGSQQIPFPVFTKRSDDLDETIQGWDAVGPGYFGRGRRRHAWASRDARAIFRGGVLGKSCWRGPGQGLNSSDLAKYGDWRLCGRRALFAAANRRPDKFDVHMDFVPLGAQDEYRYAIYAEGHCGWSDRLRFMLFMGAALFLQETNCREYYGLKLEPWVHYVPLDHDFHALDAAYDWAAAHEADVLAMVDNMHAYAEHVVSAAAVRAYAAHVLRHLGGALDYAPAHRPHAVPAAPFHAERHRLLWDNIRRHERVVMGRKPIAYG